MDFENDDDIDGDTPLIIHNMEEFLEQTYKFALLNLDVSMSAEVTAEPTVEKREQKKQEILDDISMDVISIDELKDMQEIYPVEKARDILLKYITVNECNENMITSEDMATAVMNITKEMLFSLFDRMQKENLIELVWDTNKNDFAYRAKADTSIPQRDEKDSIRKEKPKTKRKKK